MWSVVMNIVAATLDFAGIESSYPSKNFNCRVFVHEMYVFNCQCHQFIVVRQFLTSFVDLTVHISCCLIVNNQANIASIYKYLNLGKQRPCFLKMLIFTYTLFSVVIGEYVLEKQEFLNLLSLKMLTGFVF